MPALGFTDEMVGGSGSKQVNMMLLLAWTSDGHHDGSRRGACGYT
jgi:hypothetical protein